MLSADQESSPENISSSKRAATGTTWGAKERQGMENCGIAV